MGLRIEPLSFDLNTKPSDYLDVDKRPSPSIVKLANAQPHAQLLATFLMDNPLQFTPPYVTKQHATLEKLNKIFVANMKWQHQRPIDSFYEHTKIS